MNNKWINASKMLPEFQNNNKGYIIRYVNSDHPLEVWKQDWINNFPENRKNEIEWFYYSAEHPVESNAELPNLPNSTENLKQES